MLKKVFVIVFVVFGLSLSWLFAGGVEQAPVEQGFLRYGLQTDVEKTSVDLAAIVSGGPGKDGIPALTDPAFVSIEESPEDGSFFGILVTGDGERRFYPYSILVWHEIVNDSLGGMHYAVTFCPLCGTGIVYDREVDGSVLEFKVSGLLRESNMLMYDTQTESLWSQGLGEAIVGDRLGDMLTVIPFQFISFGELKEKYPDARVLSRDTGFSRRYGVYPYGDYEENDTLLFPVSFSDARFPVKEILYVVPFGGLYYAVPYAQIPDGESVFAGGDISFHFLRDGDEIIISEGARMLPGYFEMWFSFVAHHRGGGVVLERSGLDRSDV